MRVLLPTRPTCPGQGSENLPLGLLSQAWLSISNCLWFGWPLDPWKTGPSLSLVSLVSGPFVSMCLAWVLLLRLPCKGSFPWGLPSLLFSSYALTCNR